MIMIWLVNTTNQFVILKTNIIRNSTNTVIIVYKHFFIKLKLMNINTKSNALLTYKNSYNSKLFNLLYYTKVINIKYIGKIFKIKKFKKILILTFNYPIFKYLIWNNIKLKWRKKPKRFFFFYLNSYTNIYNMFWFNLVYLRPLNTYTTRGIYNNLFYYHKRKKKLTNKR